MERPVDREASVFRVPGRPWRPAPWPTLGCVVAAAIQLCLASGCRTGRGAAPDGSATSGAATSRLDGGSASDEPAGCDCGRVEREASPGCAMAFRDPAGYLVFDCQTFQSRLRELVLIHQTASVWRVRVGCRPPAGGCCRPVQGPRRRCRPACLYAWPALGRRPDVRSGLWRRGERGGGGKCRPCCAVAVVRAAAWVPEECGWLGTMLGGAEVGRVRGRCAAARERDCGELQAVAGFEVRRWFGAGRSGRWASSNGILRPFMTAGHPSCAMRTGGSVWGPVRAGVRRCACLWPRCDGRAGMARLGAPGELANGQLPV